MLTGCMALVRHKLTRPQRVGDHAIPWLPEPYGWEVEDTTFEMEMATIDTSKFGYFVDLLNEHSILHKSIHYFSLLPL